MTRYLIIGNGTAGTTAAEQIRKEDPDGHITIITNETTPIYSRIRLPEYIQSKIEKERLIIKPQAWHQENGITLITDTVMEDIDIPNQQAISSDHTVYPYDALLIATGSTPFIPPIMGAQQSHVMTLRGLDDAMPLKNSMAPGKKVIVIGGGLLGLEAASSFCKSGCAVTVVEFFDRLLPRQLDREGAFRLQSTLEKQGLLFKLGVTPEKITKEGVTLNSGETLAGELILICAGVRPNLSAVKAITMDVGLPPDTETIETPHPPTETLTLQTHQGIVVNEKMETSIPKIYAAGDVAELNGQNFCIWPEATEQGRVAGINMAGGNTIYNSILPSVKLKIAGISLASVGQIDVAEEMESDIIASEAVYIKTVKNVQGRVVGCIMFGDTSNFNKIVKQIKGEQ